MWVASREGRVDWNSGIPTDGPSSWSRPLRGAWIELFSFRCVSFVLFVVYHARRLNWINLYSTSCVNTDVFHVYRVNWRFSVSVTYSFGIVGDAFYLGVWIEKTFNFYFRIFNRVPCRVHGLKTNATDESLFLNYCIPLRMRGTIYLRSSFEYSKYRIMLKENLKDTKP